jgi:16S rRNA (cytosine1402-N4)-methyltransferase
VSDADFAHEPVMVDRIVDLFGPVPAGVVVDATVGGAGHAAALLDAHPHLELVGIDRDPDALGAAQRRLAPFGSRVSLVHRRFDALGEVLDELAAERGAPIRLVGALFDLGVSSPQLDRAERGFSYRHDGPLDMRMDPTQATTAADLVNGLPVDELAGLLRRHADERFAGRVARAIVAARPLTGTAQLAEVVRAAIPAATRRTGGHPATRTFQALRIAVNDELEVLPAALETAIDRLAPGGRCAVLSYHSGEDRITKARFRHHATGGWTGPAHLPPPPEMAPTVRLLTRGGWTATEDEAAANPRAASARLRAVERLAPGEEP